MSLLRDRSVNVISFLRIIYYDDNSLQIASTFPKHTNKTVSNYTHRISNCGLNNFFTWLYSTWHISEII